MDYWIFRGALNNILRKPFTPSSIYDALVSLDELNKKNNTKDMLIQNNSSINARILLVEDNEINQTVCEEMLKRVGAEVVLANDGLEAVAMCRENHFDIILMDLHMPRMNGFDASKEIRTFDEKTPIEIIAKIKPNVHIKGGDYKKDDLPETSIVELNGGVVEILSFIDNKSTTGVIEKILEVYGSNDK